MYRLTDVTKHYARGDETVTALDGVDLAVSRGSRLAVRGHAGCGKSTLLQLLGGLERPTSGTVAMDGTDLAGLSEAQLTVLRAQRIGFLFRRPDLIPALTVQENVETALVPFGVKPLERRSRAGKALAAVGLDGCSARLPRELSGGRRQLVALARALVKRPGVLLADEPTEGLEPSLRDEVLDVLEARWREAGLTVVVATRDAQVARRADRVVTLRDGRMGPDGARSGSVCGLSSVPPRRQPSRTRSGTPRRRP